MIKDISLFPSFSTSEQLGDSVAIYETAFPKTQSGPAGNMWAMEAHCVLLCCLCTRDGRHISFNHLIFVSTKHSPSSQKPCLTQKAELQLLPQGKRFLGRPGLLTPCQLSCLNE